MRHVIAIVLAAIVLSFGAANPAQATFNDAAVAACDDATAQGIYTADLYGQCIDDYTDGGD